MKPSKIKAEVGTKVVVHSRHCKGSHPGEVVGLFKDPGEKTPQRVHVMVNVDPEQCKDSRGLYDSLAQSQSGNLLRDVAVLDRLTDEDKAAALVNEAFVVELATGAAPALRKPGAGAASGQASSAKGGVTGE